MLKPKEYKPRLIEKHLDEYLNSFGAVCIEGPKYCGKHGRLEVEQRVPHL